MAQLYDVSATGLSIFIRSSVTFPAGFEVVGLADDSDPLSFAEQTVATADTNINGDLVAFGKPQVLTPTLAVVAGSSGDDNLQIILSARNKGIIEKVEMTVTYPDGASVIASNGVITSGTIGKSATSAGRVATRTYAFAFSVFSELRGR